MKSLEHVDDECFLRSLTRQLPAIELLGKELNYNSEDYKSLLCLLEKVTFEEDIQRDDITQYEEVFFHFSYRFRLSNAFKEVIGQQNAENPEPETANEPTETANEPTNTVSNTFKVPQSPSASPSCNVALISWKKRSSKHIEEQSANG